MSTGSTKSAPQSPWRGGSGLNHTCADCGASDASWASLNRGILICEECCSVHRLLGRHISQVKPLRRTAYGWPPTQLTMVTSLYAKGANSLWEHSLLHPGTGSGSSGGGSAGFGSPLAQGNKTTRRKPSPKDPVHPTKSEFIRAKYQLQSFIHRPAKDEAPCTSDDLSQQLHSSVRTANMEISLRLLCLGADPNYWHPEKGNRPLHVAAKAGQNSQCELLIIYGADQGAPDISGKTPADHARATGNNILADRLIECQYELTDRLAFFLCSRKPDHAAGQHFVIPEMGDTTPDLSELTRAARKSLQTLSNPLFETLAMDVYDEVDRREMEVASEGDASLTASNRRPSGFLPINEKFSTMHNQARQKLGTLNSRDFTGLIIDVLTECRRRQGGSTSSIANDLHSPSDLSHPSSMAVPVVSASSSSDSHTGLEVSPHSDRTKSLASGFALDDGRLDQDGPLYDVVAHDDDYMDFTQFINPVTVPVAANKADVVKPNVDGDGPIYAQVFNTHNGAGSGEVWVSRPNAADGGEGKNGVTMEEYMEIKRALKDTMERERDLSLTVSAMKHDLSQLHAQVGTLLRDKETNKKIAVVPRSVSDYDVRPSASVAATLQLSHPVRDDSGIQEYPDEKPPADERLSFANGRSTGAISPRSRASMTRKDLAASDQEMLNCLTSQITQSIHELKSAAEVQDIYVVSECAYRIQDCAVQLAEVFYSVTKLIEPLSDLRISAEKLSADSQKSLEFEMSLKQPTADVGEPGPGATDSATNGLLCPVPSPRKRSPSRKGVLLPQTLIDDAYNVAMCLKNVLVQYAATAKPSTNL